MSKISVIVPVYNTAKFLTRCLNSLQNQTEKDIEFILVDDASTDKSLDIMEKFQRKDKRFKIIELSQNEGVSIARNKGIDASTGKYIGFVDSDDYVCWDYYDFLKESMESEKLQMSAGRIVPSPFPYASSKQLVDFTNTHISITTGEPSACTHLFRRGLIENDKFIKHCRFEDTAFTILMHMKSGKLVVNNFAKYYYCNDNKKCFNKIESNSSQSILDSFTVTDFLETKVKENEEFTCYQEEIRECGLCLIAGNAERIYKSYKKGPESRDLLNHLNVILENRFASDIISEYPKVKVPYYIRDSIDNVYQEKYHQMAPAECEELFKTKIKTKIEKGRK